MARRGLFRHPPPPQQRPKRQPPVVLDPYPAAVLADGPYAYWRLGELSGTTAYDEISAYQLTYTNTPTLGATGLIYNDSNTAVSFAAASNENAFGNPLGSYTGSITLEAWVKPGTITGNETIVIWGSTGSGNDHFWLYYTSSSLVLEWGVTAGTGAIIRSWTPVSGTVYHVVAWYNPSGTASRLYVNGTQLGTTSSSGGTALGLNAADTVAIGASNGAGADALDGTIDEVAIYKSILSDARITAHYDAGKAPVTFDPATVDWGEDRQQDSPTATRWFQPDTEINVIATPGAPSIQSATSGQYRIDWTWNLPSSVGSSAITAVEFWRGPVADRNAFALIATLGPSATSYTDIIEAAPQANGNFVNVAIRAVNSQGAGAWDASGLAGYETPTHHLSDFGDPQATVARSARWFQPDTEAFVPVVTTFDPAIDADIYDLDQQQDRSLQPRWFQPDTEVNVFAVPIQTSGFSYVDNEQLKWILRPSWNEDTDVAGIGTQSYNLYRSDGSPNGPWVLIANVPAGISKYNDHTVNTDTVYWYRVAGVNAIGEGAIVQNSQRAPQPREAFFALDLSGQQGRSNAAVWFQPDDGFTPFVPPSFDPATIDWGEDRQQDSPTATRWFQPDGDNQQLLQPLEGGLYPLSDLPEQPQAWKPTTWFQPDTTDAFPLQPLEGGLYPLTDLPEQPQEWRPTRWFQPDPPEAWTAIGLPSAAQAAELAGLWQEQPAAWTAPVPPPPDDAGSPFVPPSFDPATIAGFLVTEPDIPAAKWLVHPGDAEESSKGPATPPSRTGIIDGFFGEQRPFVARINWVDPSSGGSSALASIEIWQTDVLGSLVRLVGTASPGAQVFDYYWGNEQVYDALTGEEYGTLNVATIAVNAEGLRGAPRSGTPYSNLRQAAAESWPDQPQLWSPQAWFTPESESFVPVIAPPPAFDPSTLDWGTDSSQQDRPTVQRWESPEPYQSHLKAPLAAPTNLTVQQHPDGVSLTLLWTPPLGTTLNDVAYIVYAETSTGHLDTDPATAPVVNTTAVLDDGTLTVAYATGGLARPANIPTIQFRIKPRRFIDGTLFDGPWSDPSPLFIHNHPAPSLAQPDPSEQTEQRIRWFTPEPEAFVPVVTAPPPAFDPATVDWGYDAQQDRDLTQRWLADAEFRFPTPVPGLVTDIISPSPTAPYSVPLSWKDPAAIPGVTLSAVRIYRANPDDSGPVFVTSVAALVQAYTDQFELDHWGGGQSIRYQFVALSTDGVTGNSVGVTIGIGPTTPNVWSSSHTDYDAQQDRDRSIRWFQPDTTEAFVAPVPFDPATADFGYGYDAQQDVDRTPRWFAGELPEGRSPGAPPDRPTNAGLGSTRLYSTRVTWTAPSGPGILLAAEVWRARTLDGFTMDVADWQLIATLNPSVNSYIDQIVVNTTTYNGIGAYIYGVRYTNALGPGAWGDVFGIEYNGRVAHHQGDQGDVQQLTPRTQRWFQPDAENQQVLLTNPPTIATVPQQAPLWQDNFEYPNVRWRKDFSPDMIEAHQAGPLQPWLFLSWGPPVVIYTGPQLLIDAETGEPYLYLGSQLIIKAG